MELLLNLIWVLLAVPAFWLWRRETLPTSGNRYLSPARCVLVLGFALLILFPVISATDDLRAMQTESEESSSGRRAIRSAENEKNHLGSVGPTAALVGVAGLMVPPEDFCGLVLAMPVQAVIAFSLDTPNGRAPPSSLLA